ncbi:MAG TPA: hypothetical protein VKA01_07550 [Vicinamibacteria bacterium]|nr:hypothetical protein [Vicinamibacteria bacterium]
MTNALRTHTNGARIVVLKGAYVYKPEKGAAEKRSARANTSSFPAATVTPPGPTLRRARLFFMTSDGKFDLNFVK